MFSSKFVFLCNLTGFVTISKIKGKGINKIVKSHKPFLYTIHKILLKNCKILLKYVFFNNSTTERSGSMPFIKAFRLNLNGSEGQFSGYLLKSKLLKKH